MRWKFSTLSSHYVTQLGEAIQLIPKAREKGEPDMLMTSMSGKSSWRKSSTFCTPFETMFIPMASPVLQLNLMYRFLPAMAHCTPCSLANLLDLLTFDGVPKQVSKRVMLNYPTQWFQNLAGEVMDERKKWFWLLNDLIKTGVLY